MYVLIYSAQERGKQLLGHNTFFLSLADRTLRKTRYACPPDTDMYQRGKGAPARHQGLDEGRKVRPGALAIPVALLPCTDLSGNSKALLLRSPGPSTRMLIIGPKIEGEGTVTNPCIWVLRRSLSTPWPAFAWNRDSALSYSLCWP